MANKIVYAGDDKGYLDTLRTRFAKFPQLAIQIHTFNATKEEDIQELFLKIIAENPQIIYVDLSKNEVEFLHLCRLLNRVREYYNFHVIGLLDIRLPEHIKSEAALAGNTVNHIKCGEYHDVVFDALYLAFQDTAPELNFAKADLKNEEVMAHELCKISYIHQNGLGVESDQQLAASEKIELKTFFIKEKTIPCPLVQIVETNPYDLFYHFKYATTLNFLYAPDLEILDKNNVELTAEKTKDREEAIAISKNKFHDWIKKNKDKSRPKNVKMLVVDSQYSFLKGRPRSDKYPFVIRTIPYFKVLKNELANLLPLIIVFQFDVIKEGDNSPLKNSVEIFKTLIKTIKEFEGYSPYIISFNTPPEVPEIAKMNNFTQLLASPAPIDPEVVLKMAQKVEAKFDWSKDELKIVMPKDDPRTIAEIVQPITVIAISESDIYFSTNRPIDLFTTLRIEHPAPFYFTVVAPPKGAKVANSYYGLIHTTGEEEKKKIRQYINSIFFRELEEKKKAEKEEFEKLQASALAKKQSDEEALKKAKEEAEKKEKEEK
jgi:hypothetical protein